MTFNPVKKRVISFGIIGTGRIAHDFAADLKHVADARLHSVLSRSMTSAEAFKKAHHATQAYDSIDEFVNDPAVDIIYVASPNSAHVAQGLRAIRAGKAVLIEKPAAPSKPEAEVIFREAARSGVIAMEAMWIRFLPGILKARSLIRDGAIGRIVNVRGELSYKNQYDPQSRIFSKALGGGASLDLGVYPLSLCLFLFGDPQKFGGTWRAAPTGVDASAAYQLFYQSPGPHQPAFQADLVTSIDRNGGNVFEVEGTDGVLRIENPFIQAKTVRILRGRAAKLLRASFGRPMTVLGKLAARLPLLGQEVHRFDYPGNGLQFEAAAMADAVRSGNVSSLVSPAQSTAVLRIIGQVLSRPAE